MANVSFANGTYTFKFPKNKTAEQCAEWLIRLNNTLDGEDIFYATRLSLPANKENLINDISSSDNNSICIRFDGDGRWCYSRNIEWFRTDKDLSSLLLEMDGIEIIIDYTDYEFGNMFIGAGRALVSCDVDTVKVVEHFESEKLTLESFLDYEAGDEEMWNEIMGINNEEDSNDGEDEEETPEVQDEQTEPLK